MDQADWFLVWSFGLLALLLAGMGLALAASWGLL
jgi:hypothetical protein